MRRLTIALFAACIAACAKPAPGPDMNSIAERYVKLVLRVGQHDKAFVDAYYGNPDWQPTGTPLTLTELDAEAEHLQDALKTMPSPPDSDELGRLRRSYLEKQLLAVRTRIAIVGGAKFTFDEEAVRLYDAAPPKKTEADFQPVLDELSKLL